jgi:phage terminase large subunit
LKRTVSAPYLPTPPQRAFRNSGAKVRGYGGAMGGGKSRGICEEIFDLSLEFPGLQTLLARQEHTSITETTKKTMIEQVLPPELIAHQKQSGGEDYVDLVNGSRINFVGLDKPSRWFSSEIGLLVVDQVEECSEQTIVLLITRLRQVLRDGRAAPNKVILSFNPDNPGHWLQRWFLLGAAKTEFGYYKRELWTTGAMRPIGDAEFVFARAMDNPHLPAGYVEETLGGLPAPLRKRMLDGEWLFTSGTTFFDAEALEAYTGEVVPPRWTGTTCGADERLRESLKRSGADPGEGKIRFRAKADGLWAIWETPVRERINEQGRREEPHRYIATVDVSSGGATDFSGIQVIDVETFEQVAEFQDKIDPDLLAVEAYRIGRIYNDALVAPEVTGGWGVTIVLELQRLKYPRLYTRRILDRRTKRFTDKLGWDTSQSTRPMMLDSLERVLRERELRLYGERTLAELITFVRNERGRPEAQTGCNDDLTITLAMAVALRDQMPRQLRRPAQPKHVPQFAATGY